MNSNLLIIASKNDLEKLVEELVHQLPAALCQRDWLTQREAATMLGISTGKVNTMRYNRQITYTQTSERTFLYERKSIENILEKNRQNALF